MADVEMGISCASAHPDVTDSLTRSVQELKAIVNLLNKHNQIKAYE